MAGCTFRALNFPPLLYSLCHCIHPSKKFYPIRFILFPLTRSSKTRFIKPCNSLTNPSSISPDSNDSVSSSGFDLVSTTEHTDGSVIFKFGNAAEIITDTVVSEEIEEMPRNDSILVSSDVDEEGCCEETNKEEVVVMSNTSDVVDEGLNDKDDNGVESSLVNEELQEESVAAGNCEPIVSRLESSIDSVEGDMEKIQGEAMEVNSSVDVDQIKEEEVDDFSKVLGEDDPSEEDVSRFNSTEIVEVVEDVSPQLREESVDAVISESVGTGLESRYDSVEGDMKETKGETRRLNSTLDVDQIKEEETDDFTRVLGEEDPSEEAVNRFNSTEIVQVVEAASPQLQEECVGTSLESSYDSVEGDIEKKSTDVMEVNGSVDVDQIQEEEADEFTRVLGEDDPSEEAASQLNSTKIVEVVEEVSPQLREENVCAVISESVGTGLESSYASDVVKVNGSVDVDRTKEKEPNEFTGVLGEDDPSTDASHRFSSTELVEVVGETSLHALENHDGRSTLESSKRMEDIVSLLEFHTENNDQATIATLEMTDSKQIGSQDVETSFDINSEEKEMSSLRLTISSGATMLPHPSKALTGGEDAYFIACQNWFGVADGAGQWSLEGNNAGIYARELMENSAKVVSENERDPITDPTEILVRSAAVSTSSGSSTALVAHFTGKALHVANLGDSGFIVIRDGSIFMKSRPMFYGFNFPVQIAKGLDPSQSIESYTVDTAEGDVIICATDALFDNLYDNEIALIVSKSLESGLEPKEIAEHLAAITQEVAKSSGVRSPLADAAQAAGYSGISGGKLDDVTVIVSLVHN